MPALGGFDLFEDRWYRGLQMFGTAAMTLCSAYGCFELARGHANVGTGTMAAAAGIRPAVIAYGERRR